MSWATEDANGSKEREVTQATDERIKVAVPEIVGVRLTRAACAHGGGGSARNG
jgi:hypothetical protein